MLRFLASRIGLPQVSALLATILALTVVFGITRFFNIPDTSLGYLLTILLIVAIWSFVYLVISTLGGLLSGIYLWLYVILHQKSPQKDPLDLSQREQNTYGHE